MQDFFDQRYEGTYMGTIGWTIGHAMPVDRGDGSESLIWQDQDLSFGPSRA